MGQDPSPELLPPDGETAPLSVGQAERTAAQLFAKDSILLTEIVDQILLPAVQPTGGSKDEEVQCMRHPARLPGIGFNLFSAIGLRLADLRHPTGMRLTQMSARIPSYRSTS